MYQPPPMRRCFLLSSWVFAASTFLSSSFSSSSSSWLFVHSFSLDGILPQSAQRPRITSLSAKNQHLLDVEWFPAHLASIDTDNDTDSDSDTDNIVMDAQDIEMHALELLKSLIRTQLDDDNTVDDDEPTTTATLSEAPPEIQNVVRGRFLDLAGSLEGERVLEDLFGKVSLDADDDDHDDEDAIPISIPVVQAAVMALQSTCILATQTGLKGTNNEWRVRHLDDSNNNNNNRNKNKNAHPRSRPNDFRQRDLQLWDRESIRRLKFRLDTAPAIQLLAALQWKRSPQGALELLQRMGAYSHHECLPLIRSGFPLRFDDEEMEYSRQASNDDRDPDSILGIRQDLRHLKVYTIDGKETTEIDDGLSVENVEIDGVDRQAIWVHIADADRWAPRHSPLLQVARKRLTSVYLPQITLPMFPAEIAADRMSLQANRDCCALSLRVLLNDDGSVDASSIVVTPSLVRVTYRLDYDDVDDMLAEGIGYQEEWELGALLEFAKSRRAYRVSQGSTEGFVPNPIPQLTPVLGDIENTDAPTPADVDVQLSVEISHNAGLNHSSCLENNDSDRSLVEIRAVSPAHLLVTEAMVLAGEAIGAWQQQSLSLVDDSTKDNGPLPNTLRLPFRTQEQPDWKTRARERKVMDDLKKYHIGDGLCQAWYARRFFSPAFISETAAPHFGLGIRSYVQWSSPIRRFSDLQAHATIKRYLRRQKVNEMIASGESIPSGILASDLGMAPDTPLDDGQLGNVDGNDIDRDINFLEGVGLYGIARAVQRESNSYWIFEYIRRLQEKDPDFRFNAIVLGCTDPAKRQFAVYIEEMAFEHKILSPGRGRLDPGTRITLRVDKVSPQHALLSFVNRV